MLTQELKKLGLSDKEAKVYLASLELGPSPIKDIAKQANLNRATTYVIIDSLIEKGLASSFTKGKKKYFSTESPDRLLSLLRVREKETQEQEREFKRVLPELREIYNLSGEKPKVRFFEGKEGIKAIQEDISNTKTKTMEEFFNLDIAYEIFPPGPKDHRRKMKQKLRDIPIRIIYTSRKENILPKKEGLRENRFVSLKKFGKFPFTGEFVIYGDKVAATSPGGKTLIPLFVREGPFCG